MSSEAMDTAQEMTRREDRAALENLAQVCADEPGAAVRAACQAAAETLPTETLALALVRCAGILMADRREHTAAVLREAARRLMLMTQEAAE